MIKMTVLYHRIRPDVAIVNVVGRLEAGAPQQLEAIVQNLHKRGQHKVLLNLAETVDINSGGIAVLVSLFTQTQVNGGELKLFGLTKKVHDLLQLTKLYTVFDTKYDAERALQAFSNPDKKSRRPKLRAETKALSSAPS